MTATVEHKAVLCRKYSRSSASNSASPTAGWPSSFQRMQASSAISLEMKYPTELTRLLAWLVAKSIFKKKRAAQRA